MVKNCALVLTSYPARLMYVPKVIEAWTHSKEQPEKKVLYLSLTQYPNRDKDVPANILSINVTPMIPAQDRKFMPETNDTYLGQEYCSGNHIQQFQDLLIREYPKEYKIAKAFVGGNALWVKPKKKNIVYRAIRKIYREIRERISL